MEFDLIPQVVIIFSVGAIIFILGKNIPKIKEAQDRDLLFEKENKKERKKFSYLCSRLIRRVKKDSYRERTDLVWKWLEKSLRKIRIKFLRLDNKIISVLEKLKKKHTKYENNSGGEVENFGGGENDVIGDVELKENEKNDFKFSDLNNNAERDNFINSSKDEFRVDRIASEEKKTEKGEYDESKNEDRIKSETEDKKKFSEDANKLEKKDAKVNKEKEYIDLILRSPKNIKAYWKLGIVYSRRKKYKDSISCFRQIIKIDPGYTKAKKKIIDLIRRMKKDKKVDGEK